MREPQPRRLWFLYFMELKNWQRIILAPRLQPVGLTTENPVPLLEIDRGIACVLICRITGNSGRFFEVFIQKCNNNSKHYYFMLFTLWRLSRQCLGEFVLNILRPIAITQKCENYGCPVRPMSFIVETSDSSCTSGEILKFYHCGKKLDISKF